MTVSISEKSRKVLAAIQFQATLPLRELARQTGLHAHTVRHSIESMLEAGVIRPYTIINSYRLGFREYGVFFQRAASAKEDKTRLLNCLMNEPGVGGLSEFAGHFHFGLLYYCREVVELESMLERLYQLCPGDLHSRAHVERIEWRAFRAKYMTSERARVESLGATAENGREVIDELDSSILSLLGKSPALARREIPRALGIPASTLDYRIRSLEKRGIIVGHAYWVHSQKLGGVPYRLFLSAKLRSAAQRDQLFSYAADHPYITGIARSIGHWDFEMRVDCFGARGLAELEEDLMKRFGSFIELVRVANLVENLKISLFPFRNYQEYLGQLSERPLSTVNGNFIAPKLSLAKRA